MQREITRDKSGVNVRVRLSPREAEIAFAVLRGMTNRKTARSLRLSETTVARYIASLLSNLRLANRTQLAMWAVSHEGALLPDWVPLAMHRKGCDCSNDYCRAIRDGWGRRERAA